MKNKFHKLIAILSLIAITTTLVGCNSTKEKKKEITEQDKIKKVVEKKPIEVKKEILPISNKQKIAKNKDGIDVIKIPTNNIDEEIRVINVLNSVEVPFIYKPKVEIEVIKKAYEEKFENAKFTKANEEASKTVKLSQKEKENAVNKLVEKAKELKILKEDEGTLKEASKEIVKKAEVREKAEKVAEQAIKSGKSKEEVVKEVAKVAPTVAKQIEKKVEREVKRVHEEAKKPEIVREIETEREIKAKKPSKPAVSNNVVVDKPVETPVTPSKPKEKPVPVTPKPVPNPTVKTPAVKTSPEAPLKKDDVRVESKTEREVLKYKTVSKHSSGKSRVARQGTNGYIERTYKITYKNGVQVSKELSDTKTVNPQNEIIQHYVKVRDARYETREVDDKSKPIHEGKSISRWFVSWGPEGKERTVEYYYSSREAFNRYDQIVADTDYAVNWGSTENEFDPNGGEIIGYEKKTEKVKVQDEVWEWQ